VGRWENDTLVVDATNFTSKVNYRGADKPRYGMSGSCIHAGTSRRPCSTRQTAM
jgi:hypothetical protein